MAIGYYDPETLTLGDRVASIDFISAKDQTDRRRVEVRSRKEADVLLHNLRHQRDHQISALGGRAMICRGPIQMSPGVPDEGVMMVDGDKTRLLPVKIGFDLDGFRIPDRALMGAVGHISEGALIAERAAIAPLTPIPSHASTPRQMN
jgi:hypothetical protein